MAKELNAVYEHIAEEYGLRLKAQIPHSGLCFEWLWDVQDALSGNRFRVLKVNDKIIRFTDRTELIEKLLRCIELLEKEVARDLKELQRHQQEDLVVDKHAMFYETEDLSVREGKLDQLKKRLLLLQAKGR